MSKNRFIRLVALAGCSVLIGAFGYTPSATAHIGASHSPPSNDRPNLQSATIVGTKVRVCFDEVLASLDNDSAIVAESYDNYTNGGPDDAEHGFNDWGPDASVIDVPPNDNCVLLDGADDPSLEQHRIVSVHRGSGPGGAGGPAVTDDDDGLQSSHGAVLLGGALPASALHETDAPELLTAARVAATSRARYGFDEPVDDDVASLPNPSNFGFYDDQGVLFTGTTTTVVDDNEVEVDFGTDPIADARRFVVFTDTDASTPGSTTGNWCQGDAPAVFDMGVSVDAGAANAGSKFNVLDHIAVAGGTTIEPDPTAARVIDSDTIEYDFDSQLDATSFNLDCFYAYEADGSAFLGDSLIFASNTASGAKVQVDFDVNGAMDQIVIAGADQCAVEQITTNDCSTIGSFDFSDRLEPGFSDGPDLEQATRNIAANRVTYCFDIDDEIDAGDVDEDDFRLEDQQGDEFRSDTFVGVGPANCVTVGFDEPDAVRDGVLAGAQRQRAHDLLPTEDIPNRESGDIEAENFMIQAEVKVDGPPPTGIAPPPTPPTPPGPTPPGVPTVTTGLCDPNRATAPLAELVIGDNGPNLICGFGGDDTLRGLKGADTLKGGPGSDTHAGGAGKDSARGGGGNDTLKGGKGPDTLKGGPGRDTARGGKGNDLCRAETEKGCEK